MLAAQLVLGRVAVVDVVGRIGEASCRRAARRAPARRRPAPWRRRTAAGARPAPTDRPACVTACSGSAGASSSSVRPALPSPASSRSSSPSREADQAEVEAELARGRPARAAAAPRPSRRSAPAGCRPARRRASAPRSCARARSPAPRSSPSLRAASTRPWPAMMPFAPSTSTGLVQPNSRMLRRDLRHLRVASACADCARTGSARPAAARRSRRSSIVQNLTKRPRIEVLLRAEIQGFRRLAPGYPPPEFRGHTQRDGPPGPCRPILVANDLPPGGLGLGASAPAALARGLGVVAGLAQPLPSCSRPRTASGRRGAARRGRPPSPARCVPGLARHAQRVPRQERGPSPAPARTIASARCARTLPVQLPLHLRRAPRPGGRCTGGLTGTASLRDKPATSRGVRWFATD